MAPSATLGQKLCLVCSSHQNSLADRIRIGIGGD